MEKGVGNCSNLDVSSQIKEENIQPNISISLQKNDLGYFQVNSEILETRI